MTLPALRHRFTHLDATYRPVVLAGSGTPDEDRLWVALDDPGVALPVAQQKIARASLRVLDAETSDARGPRTLI